MSRPERGSRVVAALLAVGCILVAAVGTKLSEPNTDTVDIATVIGRPIELGGGEFVVTGVRAGSTIVLGDDDSAKTPGLFLVVTARLAAPNTKVTLGGLTDAELVVGGRTYGEYDGNAISAEAGYVSTADFVFEVDPTRLAGLKFQINRTEVIHGLQDQGVVDLGITAANADRWRARQGQVLQVQQFQSTQAMT